MSINSSTSQQNSSKQPSSDASVERTEWDELEALAAMTGYTLELPSGKPKSASSNSDQNKAEQLQTDGSEDEEQSLLDPEDVEPEAESKTKVAFWKHPIAKSALVITLMGLLLGGIGLFVSKLNNGSKKPQEPNPGASEQEVPKADADQSEIGRLKTLNALGSQAQTLSQSSKPTQTQTTQPAAKSQRVRPTTVAERTIVRSQPAISYTPPPSYSPPLRTVTPHFQNFALPVTAYSRPTSPVDPTEAWENALKVGSFGEGGEDGSASNAGLSQVNEPASAGDQALISTNAIAQSNDSRYEADAAALLSGTPRQTMTIAPGSTVTAMLTTPIVWAQDLKSEQQPQQVTLQLTQPFYSTDGTVAFPEGTQMVAKVDAISNNGMVQLSVIAATTARGSGSQVIEVPTGSLLVSGKEGKPLLAENQHANGRGAEMAVKVALAGALGQVGTLLNRPSNQTTTTSPYLSTTSIANGKTNILGGLLQGAFNPLVKQMQERQRQEIEEVSKRPNIWYVPAGQELQVFTNSLFEVSR